MSAGAQVDYEALAKQAGAISSQPAKAPKHVDYAALAKQAGATNSIPGAPEGLPGVPKPPNPILGENIVDAPTSFRGLGLPHTPGPGLTREVSEKDFAEGTRNAQNVLGIMTTAATLPVAPAVTIGGVLGGVGGGAAAKYGAKKLGAGETAQDIAEAGGSLVGGLAGGIAGGKVSSPVPKVALETAAKSSIDPEVVRTQAQGVIKGDIEPALASTDTPAGKMARTFGIKDAPPAKLLTQAIKPMASNTGWDSAIAKAAPDIKAAEVNLGHPITGVDDALTATGIAKKGLWKSYEAKLKAAGTAMGEEETGAHIDGNQVADAIEKSIDKRTALQNPQLAERIKAVADTYRRDIPVEEAEDFLQSANNDLHSYYAKNKVGQHVAERDPSTGYVVKEADALRESLYSKLDEVTGEGAKDLKGRYGALSNVENELMRRKNVAARAQPESLQEQLTMARSYGQIARGVFTASPGKILEGTESIAAAKWLKERGTTDAMITRAFEALGGASK